MIGLGTMGGPMARHIASVASTLYVYDRSTEALAAAVKDGGTAVESIADLIAHSDVVCTSLPDFHVFVQVAEGELLPAAREGQRFIDFGTTKASETVRLAAAFAERGARLVDAPVSGGGGGAKAGTLRVFAGGRAEDVEAVRPILEAVGDPARVVYCGPSGQGQAMKVVNQLGMGLVNAAVLEAASFGRRAGLDLAAMEQAIGGEGGFRGLFSAVLQKIGAGAGEDVGIKYGQLGAFSEEAGCMDHRLPISEALLEFCRDAELVTVEAGRPSPSFWRELTGRRPPTG